MQILNGQEVARARREKIKASVADFTRRHQRAPGLTVILVGEDPASHVYVRNKVKGCEEAGIVSNEIRLSATVTAAGLRAEIDRLNAAPDVDGILVQLPLPKHLNSDEVTNWIDPRKDPDGLTVENIGLMWAGRARAVPCTPLGVMAIFDYYAIKVAGKNAVVVGRSNIVGKPMAQLLLQADASVTICHSKTPNLREHTAKADIVVVAAGRAHMLGREDFKKGAVVVDVGIHRLPAEAGKSKLVGDVRFHELDGWASAATPVPGGVGPMTITMLLENTLRLAELSVGLKS